MNATNRASLFAKIHKVLRKHYQPAIAPSDRSALEHLLYACVLENAKHDAVDEVFARLQKNYFDWNEVRVTSVHELAELMSTIPDAADSAKRLRRALQSVFERYYQFDIDALRKAGLGKAVELLQKFNGITPFVVDYMVQNALGGHSIPINTGAMTLLTVVDAVAAADAAKNRVPGLERAIPKNKAPEFSSLLHQFGADYYTHPHSPRVKSIILEIDPTAKDRMPKKAPPAPPPPPPRRRPAPAATSGPGAKPASSADKRPTPPDGKQPPAPPATAGRARKSGKLPAAPKASERSSRSGDKSPEKSTEKSSEKSPEKSPDKSPDKSTDKSSAKQKSSTIRLSRKKPK